MSRTGETFVDIRDATVVVLADRPELVMTHARLRTEGGPPLHVHRRHADTFVILEGELQVGLGDEGQELGGGTAWSAPIGVPHGYRHEGSDEVRFLNLHTPGVNFADYLFGERKAEEADQYEPPEDGGRPASDAVLLDYATQGELIRDVPESTVRILVDDPALTMTWTRYVEGEDGPGPHIHREHSDAFFVLSGQLVFRVGPELERVEAGPNTFVLAPPELVHAFRNEGPGEATWLNFHAPSAGFADFLRNQDSPWDSFDAPAGGGRPVSEAVIQHVQPA